MSLLLKCAINKQGLDGGIDTQCNILLNTADMARIICAYSVANGDTLFTLKCNDVHIIFSGTIEKKIQHETLRRVPWQLLTLIHPAVTSLLVDQWCQTGEASSVPVSRML